MGHVYAPQNPSLVQARKWKENRENRSNLNQNIINNVNILRQQFFVNGKEMKKKWKRNSSQVFALAPYFRAFCSYFLPEGQRADLWLNKTRSGTNNWPLKHSPISRRSKKEDRLWHSPLIKLKLKICLWNVSTLRKRKKTRLQGRSPFNKNPIPLPSRNGVQNLHSVPSHRARRLESGSLKGMIAKRGRNSRPNPPWKGEDASQ